MTQTCSSIFSGENCCCLSNSVNRVRAFEEGLLTTVRSKNADILDDIRKTNDLTADTEKKLKGVVEGYTKTFA